MKRSLLLLLIVPLVTNACASGGALESRDAAADSSLWRGDSRLYRILLPYPMAAAQRDSLAVYARANTAAMNGLLAEAAMDSAAPASVRVNALHILAQRGADEHMRVFRDALLEDDVRVRASAVAAMRDLIVTHPREAFSIVRIAVSDTAPEVQAQALQLIGDSDVPLLRDYAARTTNPDLRTIALDLIGLAERRGAPLIGDSAGVLRRNTASGWRISFTPDRQWPQWQAGYGTVTLEHDDASAHVIRGVEAVAGVIPVFISADGRYAVFERDRTIVVRSLQDGAEHIVGAGIAPRLRPFTDGFVFLVERAGSAKEQREKTIITYDVFTMPFDVPTDAKPTNVGTFDATIGFGEHGSYSPVRWMRVEERAGYFYLNGTNMSVFPLPDPFGRG